MVDGLAAGNAQLELGLPSLHYHLVTLVDHLEEGHAVGEAGVDEFDGGGQFYCSSNDHAQLSLVLGLAPVLDLGDGQLFNALFSTKFQTAHRSLEVELAEHFLAVVQAVKCWEDLELEGDVAFHFWLLPDVDAGSADEAFVAFGEVLPETGEEMAVFAG